MLSFLVPSRARRRLLELLFGRGARGSVSELSRQAGVSYANAYRELQAMKELELLDTVRADKGGAEVFFAHDGHPNARLLKELVSRRQPARLEDPHAMTVKGWLRALGAPLAEGGATEPPPSQEDAVADGVKLAHRDAAVARALPLVFFYHRDHLDPRRLVERARRDREKRAMGLLLEMTSELSGDPRFRRWAARLRDHRVRVPRDFFPGSTASPRARELAERNTPTVARKWGYRMNMDLDNFRGLFDKFKNAPVHA